METRLLSTLIFLCIGHIFGGIPPMTPASATQLIAFSPTIEESFETKIQKSLDLFASIPRQEVTGFKGQSLAAWSFFAPRAKPLGSILLVQGYTETAQKYSELIYDFVTKGFDVFTYDHRGMGESGRLAGHPQIVHVGEFQDYIEDLKLVIHNFVLPKLRSQNFGLLAHSMGGLVTSLALLDMPQAMQPHQVVLTGPLLEMNTSPFSNNLSYYMTTALTMIGFGDRLAPGRAFIRKEDIPNLENAVTSSRKRRAVQLEMFKANENSLMCGPSNQWVSQALSATRRLHERLVAAKQNGNKLMTPPILLYAPGRDFLVNQEGFKRFCDLVPTCMLQFLPESMHEVLHEEDSVRSAVLNKVMELFTHV